jgi:hypothetical protein
LPREESVVEAVFGVLAILLGLELGLSPWTYGFADHRAAAIGVVAFASAGVLAGLFTINEGIDERARRTGGDRGWRDVVERHHALVRGELARHRGVEQDTAGDGFYATFDGPIRALRCALAIRDGVQRLGLEIRAGVHTGECEVIGGKLGGIATIIGARVKDLAGWAKYSRRAPCETLSPAPN